MIRTYDKEARSMLVKLLKNAQTAVKAGIINDAGDVGSICHYLHGIAMACEAAGESAYKSADLIFGDCEACESCHEPEVSEMLKQGISYFEPACEETENDSEELIEASEAE